MTVPGTTTQAKTQYFKTTPATICSLVNVSSDSFDCPVYQMGVWAVLVKVLLESTSVATCAVLHLLSSLGWHFDHVFPSDGKRVHFLLSKTSDGPRRRNFDIFLY